MTALGLLLLATIAGAAISMLMTVRDATEDTPAEFVGVSAEVVAGPVTAAVSIAPTSPIDPSEASANTQAPALVESVKGKRSDDGAQIEASWTAVDDATHYSLNYYVHDGNDQWFRYTDDITDTTFTMTGLQQTKAYTIAVQSVIKEGDDSYAWGWVNSDIVAPPAPELVEDVEGARSEDGKTIEVSWSASGDATHYHVNYKLHDGTQWFRYVDDWTSTSVTMKGLQPTKGYTIAVQSVKKEGGLDFAWGWVNSDPVHAPPSRPRDMSYTFNYEEVGPPSSITMYWTIPEFTGTGPNTAPNTIRYNVSCWYLDTPGGTWKAQHTNKTFVSSDTNPARYEVTLDDQHCLWKGSVIGIAAVNGTTGEAATVTLP